MTSRNLQLVTGGQAGGRGLPAACPSRRARPAGRGGRGTAAGPFGGGAG